MDFRSFYSELFQMENLEVLRNSFYRLFDEIIEQRAQLSLQRHQAVAEEVKSYIDKHYGDNALCLKSVAEVFQLSASYLGSMFKRWNGVSFGEYLNNVRLEHSVHLLLNTQKNVQEIMQAVGFDNQTSFYRCFRRKFGRTPRELRTSGIIRSSEKGITGAIKNPHISIIPK